MRIPFSWLHEYLGSEITSETLYAACTDLGIEVDDIEDIVPDFQGVVVAKIEKVEAHPSSPHRLSIVEVSTGSQIFRVVTSAQNCRPGMLVPVAPVGSIINSVSIVATLFADVESHGMLLSEKELGIGEEDDRIVELPQTMVVGADFQKYVKDQVLHLSLTPNLGHCLSVWGLARELSAKLDIPLKKDWKNIPTDIFGILAYLSPSSDDNWEIDLLADEMCSKYSIMALDGVSVSRSPYMWRRRLFLSGMRPINVIVDALNLVMLEIGQPLHAFDRKAFFQKNHVIVTSSDSLFGPRSIRLLDDQEKILPEGTLIIADGNKIPLAVGGVMGGKESGVSEDTQSIVVESAYFSMSAVRKSRKNVDLNTEASKRFERGVDPEGVLRAQYILFTMLKEALPTISVRALQYKEKKNASCEKKIRLRVSRIETVLGFKVGQGDLEEVFRRLTYPFEWKDFDTLEVAVPFYRHDVESEVDLIEDVAKIIGFSSFNLEATPKCHVTTLPNHPVYDLEKKARQALVTLGLQECITSSLISPQGVEFVLDRPVPRNAIVSVQNPMSQDQSILRPSLLPGLLDVLQRNIAFKQSSIPIFELGTIFLRVEGNIRERLVLGILLYGDIAPYSALSSSRSFDFYDLKGIWEGISHLLGIHDTSFVSSQAALYHPGRQAAVMMQGQQVGLLGELHPKLVHELDLSQRAYFMEIDLQDLLCGTLSMPVKVQPLQLYPSMERDWTITLPKSLPYQELIKTLTRFSPPIIEKIELVSLFSSEKVGLDFHNVTIRMIFRNPMKTLEQNEVDQVFQEVTDKTMQQLMPLVESLSKKI